MSGPRAGRHRGGQQARGHGRGAWTGPAGMAEHARLHGPRGVCLLVVRLRRGVPRRPELLRPAEGVDQDPVGLCRRWALRRDRGLLPPAGVVPDDVRPRGGAPCFGMGGGGRLATLSADGRAGGGGERADGSGVGGRAAGRAGGWAAGLAGAAGRRGGRPCGSGCGHQPPLQNPRSWMSNGTPRGDRLRPLPPAASAGRGPPCSSPSSTGRGSGRRLRRRPAIPRECR